MKKLIVAAIALLLRVEFREQRRSRCSFRTLEGERRYFRLCW